MKGGGAQPIRGEGSAPSHEASDTLGVPISGCSKKLLPKLNKTRLGFIERDNTVLLRRAD